MRILTLFFVGLFMFSLTACSITQVKGQIGGVSVEAKDENAKDSDGKFCPPGQAKKGNC